MECIWATDTSRVTPEAFTAFASRSIRVTPRIIDTCAMAMADVAPANNVRVAKHPVHNLVDVSCYSKQWPCLFPQHGPGRKHQRPIVLVDWQVEIVRAHPRQLLRGLIHSDGCRGRNRVNGKVYPRYQFSNRSADIRGIFCDCCDWLGIHWTQSYEWAISIARAGDVARLDEFIGPKR